MPTFDRVAGVGRKGFGIIGLMLMARWRNCDRRLGASLASAWPCAPIAPAGAYPARPVRIVVPFAGGSQLEPATRLVDTKP